MPQIIKNARSGHTGVQSIVTQSMTLLGLAVRLFTVIVETSDPVMLAAIFVPMVLNAILCVQIVASNRRKQPLKTE